MDYRKLTGFEIPLARTLYGPRDAALYALTLGAALDPADDRALDHLTDTRGPAVLPSYCVVLGHPGFWLADPRTSVDATRLVHVEEEFELLHPIPPQGEVIGRTRISDVVDKGRDKGALLYLCKEVTDVVSGTLLARVHRALLLRADGGYDGPSGRPRRAPTPPATPPDMVREIPVRPEQALLYRLNGDPNPLHLEPEAAKSAGFDRPILHGLCTFGMCFATAFMALAEGRAERVRGFGARFTAPVFPGDTLRVEMWRDGAVQARVCERDEIVLARGRIGLRPVSETEE